VKKFLLLTGMSSSLYIGGGGGLRAEHGEMLLDFDKRTFCSSRHPSVGDLGDMDGFLKGFNLNYDDTVRQLDIYYGIGKYTTVGTSVDVHLL